MKTSLVLGLAILCATPAIAGVGDDGPRGLAFASQFDTNGLVRIVDPKLSMNNRTRPIAVGTEQNLIDANRARLLDGKPVVREDDLARLSVQEACIQRGFAWAASWRMVLRPLPKYIFAVSPGDLLPGFSQSRDWWDTNDPSEGKAAKIQKPEYLYAFHVGDTPVYTVSQLACTSNPQLIGSRMAWEFLSSKKQEISWDSKQLQKKFGYTRSATQAVASNGTDSAAPLAQEKRCWSGLCEGDQVWHPFEDNLYGNGIVDRIDFDRDHALVRFEKKPGQLVSVPLKKLEKR